MARTLLGVTVLLAAVSAAGAAPGDVGRAPDAPIVSVQFIDQHRGWMRTEQGLARSDDGGSTWRSVLADAPWSGERGSEWYFSHDWQATDAQRARIAFADASGRIHFRRTTDAGEHWTDAIVTVETQDVIAVNVSFADDRHGWLMVIPEHGMNSSPGVLYGTQDGGVHWREVASVQRHGAGPAALPRGGEIAFADAQTGWLTGSETSTTPQELDVTHDGGSTWLPVHLERPAGVTGDIDVLAPPVFLNPREGRLGVRVGTAEVVYATHDAGKRWQAMTVVRGCGVFDFLNVREAWIWRGADENAGVTAGALLHTRDGGQSWERLGGSQGLGRALGKDERVTELSFVDPHHGWACVDGHAATRLLRTMDGGQSWTAE